MAGALDLQPVQDLAPAKTLVRNRLGLHFDGVADAQLRAGLARRMAAIAATDLSDYLLLVQRDDDELAALAGLLTINETYFHREPQHLRLLCERLLPRLLSERAVADPVRILSLGCSSGEEPYSIAIALRERWGETPAGCFESMPATSIRSFWSVRGRGCYRSLSFRALSSERVARWFRPGPDRHQCLVDEIRRQVSFHQVNVLDVAALGALLRPDVIFYRNLSVYFDAETRARVQRGLRALLRPNGYLIVGTTETLGNDLGLMTPREEDSVWYFVRGAAAPIPPRPGSAPVGPSVGSSSPPSAWSTAHASAARARATGLGASKETVREPRSLGESEIRPRPTSPRSRSPSAIVENGAVEQLSTLVGAAGFDAAASASSRAEPLLLLALLRYEGGDRSAAKAVAERVLKLDPWSAPAATLLARIARADGDTAAAIAHARRAVYGQSEFWPAQLLLAELYRDDGRAEQARRAYRAALRQLADASALERAGPLPPPLPIADLRALCQAQSARLGRS